LNATLVPAGGLKLEVGIASPVCLRPDVRRCAACRIDHRSSQEVTVEVPVQYFQSVIALETAVTGVLLFQIRFFATN